MPSPDTDINALRPASPDAPEESCNRIEELAKLKELTEKLTKSVETEKVAPARALPDPEDDWAMVELHRWQYGHLPGEAGTDIGNEPLSVPAGLTAMANALLDRNPGKDKPDPFNVAQVMLYAAKQIASFQAVTSK